MRQALGIVWKAPTPIFKDIEARIQRGEDLAGLVSLMREQPERLGELRGLEAAQELVGAAHTGECGGGGRPGRARRGPRGCGIRGHAGGARCQRLAHRPGGGTGAASHAGRADGEAVPALSDRAHGLLRAFAEAAEAGQDAARLAAARAADRPELVDEILRFDAALTRRFGAEAFTDRAHEPFEDVSWESRNRWAAEVLKDARPAGAPVRGGAGGDQGPAGGTGGRGCAGRSGCEAAPDGRTALPGPDALRAEP